MNPFHKSWQPIMQTRGLYVLLQLVILLPAAVSLKLQGLEPDPIVQGTGLAMSEFVGVVEETGLTISEALLEYSTDLVADPTTYKALEGLSLVETAGGLGDDSPDRDILPVSEREQVKKTEEGLEESSNQHLLTSQASNLKSREQEKDDSYPNGYAAQHYNTQNGTKAEDFDPNAPSRFDGYEMPKPVLDYLDPENLNPGLDGWHCNNGSASCYTKGGHWKGKKIRRENNAARKGPLDDSEPAEKQEFAPQPDPKMLADNETTGMLCRTPEMFQHDQDLYTTWLAAQSSGTATQWPLGYEEDYLMDTQGVVFTHRWSHTDPDNATQDNCKRACLQAKSCVAVSGVLGVLDEETDKGVLGGWCIGCARPLFAKSSDYQSAAMLPYDPEYAMLSYDANKPMLSWKKRYPWPKPIPSVWIGLVGKRPEHCPLPWTSVMEHVACDPKLHPEECGFFEPSAANRVDLGEAGLYGYESDMYNGIMWETPDKDDPLVITVTVPPNSGLFKVRFAAIEISPNLFQPYTGIPKRSMTIQIGAQTKTWTMPDAALSDEKGMKVDFENVRPHTLSNAHNEIIVKIYLGTDNSPISAEGGDQIAAMVSILEFTNREFLGDP